MIAPFAALVFAAAIAAEAPPGAGGTGSLAGGVTAVQAPAGEGASERALQETIEAEMPACAAVAVDSASGALGDGDGDTRELARDRALENCRSAGGTNCVVTSVECDPARDVD